MDMPHPSEAALPCPLSTEIWKVDAMSVADKHRLYEAAAIYEYTHLAPYLPRDRG